MFRIHRKTEGGERQERRKIEYMALQTAETSSKDTCLLSFSKCLYLLLSLSMVLFTSCQYIGGDSEIEKCIHNFSDTFYNWQFDQASAFCTDDSRKWLTYAASNVQEEDVKKLCEQQEGIDCEILDVVYDDDMQTTATAHIRIRHFLAMDTIGAAASFRDHASFTLQLVRIGNTWKVALDGLPREDR